jgi:hypothetical protein
MNHEIIFLLEIPRPSIVASQEAPVFAMPLRPAEVSRVGHCIEVAGARPVIFV